MSVLTLRARARMFVCVVCQGQPNEAAEARATARRAGCRSQGDKHAAQADAVGELAAHNISTPTVDFSFPLQPLPQEEPRPYRQTCDVHKPRSTLYPHKPSAPPINLWPPAPVAVLRACTVGVSANKMNGIFLYHTISPFRKSDDRPDTFFLFSPPT